MISNDEPKRLLLVLNDPDTLAHYARHMRSAGYVVDVARDGKNAMLSLETKPPDIVVFEVLMNGINGYQACRKLKENPSTSSIKIILLGEKTESADHYWASHVGAFSLLKKPVDLRVLLDHIQGALGEKETNAS